MYLVAFPAQGALHLETWLMSAPVDLPALKLSQDAHLTLGDSANMRDCVGRVLPFWSDGRFRFSSGSRGVVRALAAKELLRLYFLL